MLMETAATYTLAKLLLQRSIGLVYLAAFLVAANQFKALLGDHGLLPVTNFIRYFRFREAPSLFHFWHNDTAYAVVAWIGVALSLLVLTGISERYSNWFSLSVWVALWVLYLSFVNVGQTFYSFGWESILLEAGFFAIFLGNAKTATPVLVIWIMRWLLFRVMFGAGLIKLRGDSCWRDFTCLYYHFETQPMPNPLSWFFHWLPKWVHRAGVGFNHFAELIVPFGYFAPQPIAAIAGVFTILFQGALLVSGNFSWLSFITAVLALATFDDRVISAVTGLVPHAAVTMGGGHTVAVIWLMAMVVVLSYYPIRNMLSRRQVMNMSFNNTHLVGTYGAFGTITRPRYEVIVQGTDDETITEQTQWREYEFKGKPGNVNRLPGQFAPYHLRLDWLMWFAGFSRPEQQPWFFHFLAKLLQNDKATLALIRANPFSDKPPRHVRALLYHYRFTTPAERKETGAWWHRELVGDYVRPVSLDDPGFRQRLENSGWAVP